MDGPLRAQGSGIAPSPSTLLLFFCGFSPEHEGFFHKNAWGCVGVMEVDRERVGGDLV